MATNFPTSLDDATTLPAESAGTVLATNHVVAHQNLQDSMEALQAKVGIDSSAVNTSHDYKLSEVTSTDKAVGKTATQTLTDKTLTAPILTHLTITKPVLTVGSDATGDIYYRAVGGFTRLAKGTDDQILKLASGIPSWDDEITTVDGSYAAKGILQGLTDETTSGLTISTGVISVNYGTTANKIVKLDGDSKLPAVDGSNLTNLNVFNNGIETRAGDTASGNQVIAHGIAKTPKKIKITAFYLGASTNPGSSIGVYNGTTTSCIFLTDGFDGDGNSSTNIAEIYFQSASNSQKATVTIDATNITLSWTIAGTMNAADIQILWEAEI